MSADGMPAPLRVLILEDNPADLELVLRQLRVAGFDFRFESAEDEAGYTARLDSQPDVIPASTPCAPSGSSRIGAFPSPSSW
jgi:hypothetical protein